MSEGLYLAVGLYLESRCARRSDTSRLIPSGDCLAKGVARRGRQDHAGNRYRTSRTTMYGVSVFRSG
jgi:hypothetical protein